MAEIPTIFVPKAVRGLITLDPLSKIIDLELYLEEITQAKHEDLLKYSSSSLECLAALHVHYASCMIEHTSIYNTRKTYDESPEAIEIRREKMDNARRAYIEEERREKRERRLRDMANVD